MFFFAGKVHGKSSMLSLTVAAFIAVGKKSSQMPLPEMTFKSNKQKRIPMSLVPLRRCLAPMVKNIFISSKVTWTHFIKSTTPQLLLGILLKEEKNLPPLVYQDAMAKTLPLLIPLNQLGIGWSQCSPWPIRTSLHYAEMMPFNISDSKNILSST